MNEYKRILPGLLFFLLAVLSGCDQAPLLDRIMHSGKLVVGIKHDTGYYNTTTSAAKFELELLRRFAASLQLSLQLKTYPSDEQIIKALLRGKVYMAAGGLIINRQQQQLVQFTTPYRETEQILLYRMGNPQPKELADLQAGSLEIAPDSRQELLLQQIRQESLPGLTWITAEQDKSQLILPRLNSGDIEFTITSRHEFERNRAYYPHVLPGMTLSAKEHIAWGFSRTMDNGLLQAADHFLAQQAQTGELQELSKKHFKTLKPRSFVVQRDFWKHVKHRLPKYAQWFKQAAAETGMDWLIACGNRLSGITLGSSSSVTHRSQGHHDADQGSRRTTGRDEQGRPETKHSRRRPLPQLESCQDP